MVAAPNEANVIPSHNFPSSPSFSIKTESVKGDSVAPTADVSAWLALVATPATSSLIPPFGGLFLAMAVSSAAVLVKEATAPPAMSRTSLAAWSLGTSCAASGRATREGT
eukprot:scaffold113_cov339-Pavlova_lutheri.AAC.17